MTSHDNAPREPRGRSAQLTQQCIALRTKGVGSNVQRRRELRKVSVSALNSTLASCWITRPQAKLARLFVERRRHRRARQELNSWNRPKSAVDEAASMARTIARRGGGRLENCSDSSWTGNSVWQNTRQDTTRTPKKPSRSALKMMMTSEMAERHFEGPNTYLDLCICRGENDSA